MSRRRIVLFGIAVIVMIVAAGLVIHLITKAKYDIFEDHHELFEAVKDEAEQLVSNQDGQGDIENIFLYSYGGNAAANQFHDVVTDSLQGKIQQITALSKDKLYFLRYSRHDGKSIIRFVFNWEREYRDTYHIVYCESYDEVVRDYDREPNGDPVEYDLVKLGDGWYGIRIR